MAELNIKDFFVGENEVKNKEDLTQKKKAEIIYSTELVSGDSFIVRRKSSASSKLLVCIPSKELFYIQDEKKKTNVNIDKNLILGFLRDLESSFEIVDENGNHPFWISKLYRGANFAEKFAELTQCKKFVSYMPLDCVNYDDFLKKDYLEGAPENICIRIEPKELQQLVKVASKYFDKKEVKEVCGDLTIGSSSYSYSRGRLHNNTKLSSMFQSLITSKQIRESYNREAGKTEYVFAENLYTELKNRYGIEGIEKIVSAYSMSPIENFISIDYFNNIFKPTQISKGKYSTKSLSEKYLNDLSKEISYGINEFTDYAFCEVVKQGYADEPSNFYQSWADCIGLQLLVFGRIEDKYPEYLSSYERILSYTWTKNAEIKEEEAFKDAVMNAKDYEYKGSKYSIICPNSESDLIEEGRMQSNCVGSYRDYIINGTKYVFFMRANEDLKKSIVTLEVKLDRAVPELGQVLARFNHTPEKEHREFVDNWFKKTFLKKWNEKEEEKEEDAAV